MLLSIGSLDFRVIGIDFFLKYEFHSHLTVFFFCLGDRVSEFDFWALLFLNFVDVLLLNLFLL